MRIGVLSDAHGNILGLNACLGAMKRLGVDKVVFLGDAVGYLPYGAEVCARLADEGAHCLMGNHEAMVFGLLPRSAESEAVYGHDRFCGNLPTNWRDMVVRNGPRFSMTIDSHRLLFVHASPENPLLGYIRPDDDLSCSEETDYVFMGHTHRPFQRDHDGVVYMNVGSCGLPRDYGSLLAFAIFDSSTGRAELFRVPIEVERLISGDGMADVHQDVIRCFQRVCPQPFGTLLHSSNEGGDE